MATLLNKNPSYQMPENSVELPACIHEVYPFKEHLLQEGIVRDNLLIVVTEDLAYSYGLPSGLQILLLNHPDISRRYNVSFSNPLLFLKRVSGLPSSAGEYNILYDSADAIELNNTTGYSIFQEGSVLVYLEDNTVALGTITYGYTADTIGSDISDINIDASDTKIENAIDLDSSTAWIHHITHYKQNVTGALCSPTFFFGGVKKVNRLIIKPVSEFNLSLIGISYIDTNDVEILLDDVLSVIDSTQIISFDPVFAKGFTLYLKQLTYSIINIKEPNDEPLGNTIMANEPPDLSRIGKLIPNYRPAVNVIENDIPSLYNYQFGIYDIWAEYREFDGTANYSLGTVSQSGDANYLIKSSNTINDSESEIIRPYINIISESVNINIPILFEDESIVTEILEVITNIKGSDYSGSVELSFRAHVEDNIAFTKYNLEDRINRSTWITNVRSQINLKIKYRGSYLVENKDYVLKEPRDKNNIIDYIFRTKIEFDPNFLKEAAKYEGKFVVTVIYKPFFLCIDPTEGFVLSSIGDFYNSNVFRSCKYHSDGSFTLSNKISSVEFKLLVKRWYYNSEDQFDDARKTYRTPVANDIFVSIGTSNKNKLKSLENAIFPNS